MNRRVLFWVLSVLAFGIFYTLFGGLTVEGASATPTRFVVVDILAWALTLACIAGILAALMAIFFMRTRRFASRIAELFPIALFICTLVLLLVRAMVDGTGPVP